MAGADPFKTWTISTGALSPGLYTLAVTGTNSARVGTYVGNITVTPALLVEPRMNAVWALDFMRDTLYSGRVFRTLNVIDEANGDALGIDVAVSIPATRVTTFLTQMIDLHGRPTAIRCDNGPELTSRAFTDWCKEEAIELRFIQPGKPDQNAYIERFNRTYPEEVLSAYLFDSLDEVRDITTA